MDDRTNSEGLPRHKLLLALRDFSTVAKARKLDSCLLCRDAMVNESGLCLKCWSQLTDEELALALRWLSGAGP